MSKLEERFADQVRWAALPEPVREYRFARHLKRQYRFDFAWPDQKVAVELEGGIFRQDASHSSINGIKRDIEKHNLAALLGWRVFRFHTDHVKHGDALNTIEAALKGIEP